MIKLVNVTGVRALEGYRLNLRFSDGTSGIHDFSEFLYEAGPMIEPLRDPNLFRRVFISMGTLTWPNGFDIDSIRLQQEMREAGELLVPAPGHAVSQGAGDNTAHEASVSRPLVVRARRSSGSANQVVSTVKSSKGPKTAAASALTQKENKISRATSTSKNPKSCKTLKSSAPSTLTQKKR